LFDYWNDAERFSHVIGDFVWTSCDYLGEAGIGRQDYYDNPEEAADAYKKLHIAEYPWRTAGGADIDLCGFERPQLAYRRILWGSEETFTNLPRQRNVRKGKLWNMFRTNILEEIKTVSGIDTKEGIFVGYRYYDKKNIEPLFPFGFGISYTTFEYSNLTFIIFFHFWQKLPSDWS
jgi:hypothetical protein